MKKKFNFIWTLRGTDNYETIQSKFSKKKLRLLDALELERVDVVGYCDDETIETLNEIYYRKKQAELTKNNEVIIAAQESEKRFFKKRAELPRSYKLQSVDGRLFGKTMVYLLLYRIILPK